MKKFIDLCDEALNHPLVQEGFLKYEIETLKQDWIQDSLVHPGWDLGRAVYFIHEDHDQGLLSIVSEIDRFYQLRHGGKKWEELIF